MRLVAITALLRAGLSGQIDRDVENCFSVAQWLRVEVQPVRFSPALLIMMILPWTSVVMTPSLDGAQRDREAFLVRRDFLLEAFPLRDVAHHRDVKFLLIDHHLAQRNFDREGGVATRAADRQSRAAGSPGQIVPGAGDRLPVRCRTISAPAW